MINKEILGGVSPLKAKRQSSRGGKSAKKATSTARKRGGFAKSKGQHGAGGANVGGYNAQTRFKAAAWVPPPSGGTLTSPDPKKPVVVEKDGSTTIPALEGDPTKGTEERTIPGEKGKSGNEFADNCHGANGERLTGTQYYSEKKGMDIACDWDADAKDDGSFDYKKGGTDDKNQRRSWELKAGGEEKDKVFTDWEDFSNNK